jgi:penicillin-binding protein 1A
MAFMMSKVVEEGTAKRAILDGIKSAGKTGTTNSYRDAWFVGYTGNFVCGVWYGNDDYSPLNKMTGGSLPAQTWHDIMAYAHQGIELKQIAGVGPNGATVGPLLDKDGKGDAPVRPVMLTLKGSQSLQRLERMMDDAGRALAGMEPLPPAAPTAAPNPAPAAAPAAAAQSPAQRPRARGRADNGARPVAAAN